MGTLPPGHVPFERVRESLPEPRRVPVSSHVTLQVLHLDGPDPGVVFVHGGLGSLWDPYPQLARLQGERELVTYSLAGNRNSSRRPEGTLDGHVADLANLLAQLGVERPVVHGHSYGTTVALEYAKRHAVAGLVLAGGGDHDLTATGERPLLAAVRALRLYRLPVPEWLVARVVSAVACHPETPLAVAREFVAANPLPRRRTAYAAPAAFRGYDGRDDLGRIDAPALVVHGAADDVVAPELARGTADRLPRAVVRELDGAGHFPFVEQPAVYTDLLREFVDCVRTGRPLAAGLTSD